MNKPEYNQGSKCPVCGSTDTVGLIIKFADESPDTELGWCQNGCKWYKSFDGVGEAVKIFQKKAD